MSNTGESGHSTEGMTDPEPLSLALGLFAALVGGSGLVVSIIREARQRENTLHGSPSVCYRAAQRD